MLEDAIKMIQTLLATVLGKALALRLPTAEIFQILDRKNAAELAAAALVAHLVADRVLIAIAASVLRIKIKGAIFFAMDTAPPTARV